MLKIKNYVLTLTLILISISVSLNWSAAETKTPKNLGFIPSNIIWYSKDPFFAGDKIRIYSAIFNNSEYDISGTVEFYDNGNLIGKLDFALAGGGGMRDVWIDWIAAKGNHKISAKIVDGKISTIGGGNETFALENSQAGESERFVEEIPAPVVQQPVVQKDENSQNGILKSVSPKLIAVAESVIQNINAFADRQKEKLETKKEEIKKEIAAINSGEVKNPEAGGEIVKETEGNASSDEAIKTGKPLKYVFLASLSAANFVLEHKILFYLVLFGILYLILKFLFKRLRGA